MSTPNTGKGLDAIAPEGDYVLLNGWMVIPKSEALQRVAEAKSKGDDGVYAVPLALAIAAPKLLEACQAIATALRRHNFRLNSDEPAAISLLKTAIAKATNPNADVTQAYPKGRWS